MEFPYWYVLSFFDGGKKRVCSSVKKIEFPYGYTRKLLKRWCFLFTKKRRFSKYVLGQFLFYHERKSYVSCLYFMQVMCYVASIFLPCTFNSREYVSIQPNCNAIYPKQELNCLILFNWLGINGVNISMSGHDTIRLIVLVSSPL